MAFIHGKNTVVKVGASDLSAWTDSSELNRTADSHDTTTYGNDSHRKSGGLLDGKFTMSGTYDNTELTGPSAVLKPLLGTTPAVVRQTEGTGSGKPQDSFNALMTSYVETNPTADMVKWSAEFEIDGDVDTAAQV